MKRFVALVCGLVLAGCGTFSLGTAFPLQGQTKDQVQLAVLTCQDRAKLEANTAGRQAGSFALGLTIVGAPVAYELEKKKQREVWSECMTEKGYRVVPPDDGPKTAQTPPPSSPPAPTTALRPVEADTAAQLQKLRELRDRNLITAEEYEAKRKVIVDRL